MAELSPSQLRALRHLAAVKYASPSDIGYAVAEDRSRRSGGMVPQGAGRLGGKVGMQLVLAGLAEYASSDRGGYSAYRISEAGRAALRARQPEARDE